MLFKLKLTNVFVNSCSYETDPVYYPTISSKVTGVSTFLLLSNNNCFSYSHKISNDEILWLKNTITFFVNALLCKKIDSDSIINLFYDEFSSMCSLIDAGISYVKTKKSPMIYEPVINNMCIEKRLCGIKCSDGYYICEPYWFRSKNAVEFNKTIFNESELEDSFKSLVEVLVSDGLVIKEAYNPNENIEIETL